MVAQSDQRVKWHQRFLTLVDEHPRVGWYLFATLILGQTLDLILQVVDLLR